MEAEQWYDTRPPKPWRWVSYDTPAAWIDQECPGGIQFFTEYWTHHYQTSFLHTVVSTRGVPLPTATADRLAYLIAPLNSLQYWICICGHAAYSHFSDFGIDEIADQLPPQPNVYVNACWSISGRRSSTPTTIPIRRPRCTCSEFTPAVLAPSSKRTHWKRGLPSWASPESNFPPSKSDRDLTRAHSARWNAHAYLTRPHPFVAAYPDAAEAGHIEAWNRTIWDTLSQCQLPRSASPYQCPPPPASAMTLGYDLENRTIPMCKLHYDSLSDHNHPLNIKRQEAFAEFERKAFHS